MGTPTKLTLLVGGLLLWALGFLTASMGLIGIIDPVGSKMSDDTDPFGPTTTGDYVSAIFLIFFGIAKVAGGSYLIWRMDRKR